MGKLPSTATHRNPPQPTASFYRGQVVVAVVAVVAVDRLARTEEITAALIKIAVAAVPRYLKDLSGNGTVLRDDGVRVLGGTVNRGPQRGRALAAVVEIAR